MTKRRQPIPVFHPERHRLHPGEPGAGCVSIGGSFALEHHDEIIDLVRRFEERENADYPAKRIVSVRTSADNLLINTNDVRLARAIAETLHKTYQGELRFHFDDADCQMRVHWQR
ncbi:hypothetical protein [Noviherbaspirillum denitrificans]|uniref:Uncharacterized protein n=1 Tax=Noviherbaspirillum denitrificans TaxID=1968433 RepID=A0A254T7K1_9BURK|nr:hypothetical protein [Noviherbaspirillum denitrificans]OWW18629.1 hypothetical protein AYR66_03305 [Noviherbaspirillum denitrificans]